MQPSTSPTQAIPPSVSPTALVQPTQSPTEIVLPPQVTGELTGGEVAAIIIVLTLVAIAIIVVVAAIAIYYVHSRKRKYIFTTAGSPNEYGTYVTDATDTFGRPSKPGDKEDLVTSIPMESKTEALPSTSLVAANPLALELDADAKEKETLMMTGDGGEGGEGGGDGGNGDGEKGEVEKPKEETDKDTNL